ncbi:MAG: potassium channel family protein [Burkholderiaceae bacterium]
MLIVVLVCVFLTELSTVIYYEVLRILDRWLPRLHIPSRTKLLALMFAAFFAHGLEIVVYGVAVFARIKYVDVGSLAGRPLSFVNCIYFSAETYTSLGFGDLTPTGPLRPIAGVEALNGLLLIGWSASYAYFAMERFWSMESSRPDQQP